MKNSPTKNTNKHTPGPWHAQHWTRHAAATVLVDDASEVTGKRVIADCGTEADAALIAAAPDLLLALVKLTNEVMGSAEMARECIGNTNANVLLQRAQEARALIEKLSA